MRVIFFNGGRDNGVGTDEGRLVETMEEMQIRDLRFIIFGDYYIINNKFYKKNL